MNYPQNVTSGYGPANTWKSIQLPAYWVRLRWHTLCLLLFVAAAKLLLPGISAIVVASTQVI